MTPSFQTNQNKSRGVRDRSNGWGEAEIAVLKSIALLVLVLYTLVAKKVVFLAKTQALRTCRKRIAAPRILVWSPTTILTRLSSA